MALDKERIHLEVVVDASERHISGSIEGPPGHMRRFLGWLELMQELDSAFRKREGRRSGSEDSPMTSEPQRRQIP